MLRLWLKGKGRVTAAFLVSYGLLLFALWLGGEPAQVLGYGLSLSLLALAIFALADFLKFRRVHRSYETLLGVWDVFPEQLPPAKSQGEEDLQGLVEKLALQLKGRETRQAEAEEERTEYYTLWVHQIKTPIAALRVLLQSGEVDHALLEQEVFKIEEYVGMVLQYLRLESISSDLILNEYPLEDLVRQAVKKYGPLFITKKLSLKLEDFHLTVLTDEKWLVFALEQLLSNAIKYTPRGSIRIGLTEGKALFIQDTGIGILPEDLPRVFDRGFTGRNGRLDKRSTGIGLFLTKRILDRLHHPIKITSQVGRGTRVELTVDDRWESDGKLG